MANGKWTVTYTGGGAIAVGMVVLLAAMGFGTQYISGGASAKTTKDIKQVIKDTVTEMDSTMTQEEVEKLFEERDRRRFVDKSIEEYGADIESLKTEVQDVRREVGEVQRTVNSIAKTVGASNN